MTKSQIKKAIIAIGLAGAVSGFAGNYFYTEYQITQFAGDLEKFNVKSETARELSEYFNGGKDYITYDAMREWIRVVNEANYETEVVEWGPIMSKKDFIKKGNWLIQEAAKRK